MRRPQELKRPSTARAFEHLCCRVRRDALTSEELPCPHDLLQEGIELFVGGDFVEVAFLAEAVSSFLLLARTLKRPIVIPVIVSE
ncbi:hypothetical protein FJY94_03130 [Candidatus Kaiserbacteria bacterium]|nr:hypothetical protein [Candidatus Kaiserbacteria bacterium]